MVFFFSELQNLELYNLWYYPVKAVEFSWLFVMALLGGALGPVEELMRGSLESTEREEVWIAMAFVASSVVVVVTATFISFRLTGKRGMDPERYMFEVAIPAEMAYYQELRSLGAISDKDETYLAIACNE